MTTTAPHPDIVGAYSLAGAQHFHAVAYRELERTGGSFASVIATFGFKPEDFILTISLLPESIYFTAFETAVQKLGIYGTNADDSPFDAGRIESLSRQVDFVAACGASAQTIAGLRQFGHDPASVFAGRTVWARPDCYREFAGMEKVDARRFVPLGPAFGLECAHGGVHVDQIEWHFAPRDGTIHLSSRLGHVDRVDDLDTGVAGALAGSPCSCGLTLATIDLA